MADRTFDVVPSSQSVKSSKSTASSKNTSRANLGNPQAASSPKSPVAGPSRPNTAAPQSGSPLSSISSSSVPNDELSNLIKSISRKHMETAVPEICNMIVGGVLARQVREVGSRVVEELIEPLSNDILNQEMMSRVSFEMRRFIAEDDRMNIINDMVDEDMDVYLAEIIPRTVPEIARGVVIEELDRRGLTGAGGANNSGGGANGTFNMGGGPNATFNVSGGSNQSGRNNNPNATFNASGNNGSRNCAGCIATCPCNQPPPTCPCMQNRAN